MSKKLFCFASKVRLKNFFAVCDAVAAYTSADRRTIADITGISPQTVTKAVEFLLDAGILSENSSKKPFMYSFTANRAVGVVDLTQQDLRFSIYTIDGKLLRELTSQNDPSYFYDENLSFFLHESAAFVKTRMPRITLFAVTAIISPGDINQRGTRSMLTDTDRLCSMITSYFGGSEISATDSVSASQYSLIGNPVYRGSSVICTIDGTSAVCIAVDDSVLLGSTPLRDRRGVILPAESVINAYLSQEMAAAIGNVIGMLSPNRLFIDTAKRPGDITESRVSEILTNYFGAHGFTVPNIIMCRIPMSHAGAVRRARETVVRELTIECAVGNQNETTDAPVPKIQNRDK